MRVHFVSLTIAMQRGPRGAARAGRGAIMHKTVPVHGCASLGGDMCTSRCRRHSNCLICSKIPPAADSPAKSLGIQLPPTFKKKMIETMHDETSGTTETSAAKPTFYRPSFACSALAAIFIFSRAVDNLFAINITSRQQQQQQPSML